MSTQPVFRFAPSPNGELHLGHAYSALLNLRLAREYDGRCLLRIEDIDTARCTTELESRMLKDLEWIGFEWDEEPRRQSHHFEEYAEHVQTLVDRELVYPSTMSRSRIKAKVKELQQSRGYWPSDPEGVPLFPGEEHNDDKDAQNAIMASDEPFNLRLDMAKAVKSIDRSLFWKEFTDQNVAEIPADPLAWGDIVIARKDTPASYSLCCVVDDALQGITHVVRGKDLFHATSIHIVLQSVLGLQPPLYHHHDLVLDANGNKLSKSEKSAGIRALREAGLSPEDVRARLFPED